MFRCGFLILFEKGSSISSFTLAEKPIWSVLEFLRVTLNLSQACVIYS
jgi:hypothetical protein